MLSIDAPVHRLSLQDVGRMFEIGLLDEHARVELIDGILVDVPIPSAEHSGALSWLNRHFVIGCPEWEIRIQDYFFAGDGFFLPDLMVIEPLPRNRQPTAAALIVEVSVTTHRHDLFKAGRYARAGVEEYWLADVPGRRVLVHRDPHPDGYRSVTTHADGERLTAPAGAPEVVVSELLGPRA